LSFWTETCRPDQRRRRIYDREHTIILFCGTDETLQKVALAHEISHAIVCPQGQNLADPFEDSDGSPPLDPPGHGPVWRSVVLPMYARNGLLEAARTLEQYPVMARAIAEYERGMTVRA